MLNKEVQKRGGGGFDLKNYEESHIKAFLNDLVKWIIFDNSGSFDTRKGLYLFGDCGGGKTLICDAAKAFINELAKVGGGEEMKGVNCLELWEKVYSSKNTSLLKKYYTGLWYFDDLGEEETTVNLYGSLFPVMGSIISKRDRIVKPVQKRVLITSNKVPQYRASDGSVRSEILEKYGDRVWSRFQSLFNLFHLERVRDFRAG